MPLSYAKNKKHIYAYVTNNRDKINEINRRSNAKAYRFKKECERLMKIIY